MLSFPEVSTAGGVLAYVVIALCLPFLVTWLSSNFRSRWPRNGEPPMVPHWIPWVGHAYSYLFDINRFSHSAKRFAKDGAATSVVGGKHFYMIYDPKLASQIFRRPKLFGMEAFIVESFKAFGTPKEDMDVMRMGVPGLDQRPGYKDDGRRIWKEMSQMIVENLDVYHSNKMATRFLDTLANNLDKEFPKKGNSGDWVSVDLCSFIMRHYLLGSIASAFGSHILDKWPTVYEDFWSYDHYTSIHLSGIPEVFAPKAYAVRKKILNILRQWERDANEHRDIDQALADDAEWDEYWGAKLMQRRTKYCIENGISEEGRAAKQLSLLWGQNGNAIPIGTWLMIHCLADPGRTQRVAATIKSCQTPEGGFDMHRVVTHSYFKSLFLEALRYGVAAPLTRVVLETTQVGRYTFHKGNVVHIPGRELQMDDNTWSADGVAVDASEYWGERFLDLERDANGNILEKESEEERVFSKAAADAISLPVGTRSKEIRDRMTALRPFGGGSHLCPGRHFALYEIVAGMATLFTMFDIEVDQAALRVNGMPEPEQRSIGGLPPDRKFMVRIRRK